MVRLLELEDRFLGCQNARRERLAPDDHALVERALNVRRSLIRHIAAVPLVLIRTMPEVSRLLEMCTALDAPEP